MLFSGCSLITIQTDSTTAEPEKSIVSEETTAAETSAETTAETTKASETTAAETTAAPSETTAVETTVPVVAEQKGKVVVLATGGTIAGVGDAGKSAGYTPGTLTAEDLISAVPELADVADIEAIQVCNVNSDDITDKVWIELTNKINELSKDPDITGFVITHGTDTMEETAYFLNLTVKTDKPVVITGSMRPSTSISADGPMNLYESVCVAASEEAKGKGVLVVFSDLIFTARSVTKTSTYDVMAISAGELGACGVVRDGAVYFYEESVKRHTAGSEFDVSSLKELPKVSVIFFSVDMDPGILKYAAEHSDGIVIAGAGAGEFSEGFIEVVKDLKIPVVISSRIGDGIIIPDNLLVEGTIAGDNLPPQKAAVLLRLALTKTKDAAKIQEMFFEY
ncbi:MAG: asparaginase [Clostridiales bacterium]|nr:asparaginase [Clostridiales bacterium]